MFSLCPVTFLTGRWRVSRNNCSCLASSAGLEPAGPEAAQVTTRGCRSFSASGSAQRSSRCPHCSFSTSKPLAHLGFASPCPLNPAFHHPGWDGRGILGTLQCPLLGCGSSVATHPSCCFSFSAKANLMVLFQRHSPVSHCVPPHAG